MAIDDLPLELTHPRVPKLQHFALLAGLDAAVRGSLISVMPLVVHEAMEMMASPAYFLWFTP